MGAACLRHVEPGRERGEGRKEEEVVVFNPFSRTFEFIPANLEPDDRLVAIFHIMLL